MSAHLSSEQISRWMAGDRTPEASQHMRECAHCAAEAARLGALLGEFRSSVIAWSAVQKGAAAPGGWMPPGHRGRSARGALRWALAATALALMVTVPICKNASDRRREAETFRADTRLWEEVNAQVSRPIPAPLEPLMKLVAWEPSTDQK